MAAGHELTAQTAELILREGGNAFDAVLAAMCTACVTEPVLASLLVVGAATIGVATFLLNMMDLIEARRVPGARAAPADRVRPAGQGD